MSSHNEVKHTEMVFSAENDTAVPQYFIDLMFHQLQISARHDIKYLKG